MIVRQGLADRLANQAHFFNAGARVKRFTPAGPDHAQVAASAGMADYVDELYAHHVGGAAGPAERARVVTAMKRAHEDGRLEPLLDFLGNRNDVRILGSGSLGTKTGRVPTVALHTAKPAAEIADALSAHGVMAGAGDFYAVRTIGAMGCDADEGVLRLSFVHYTTDGEVQQLMKGLDACL